MVLLILIAIKLLFILNKIFLIIKGINYKIGPPSTTVGYSASGGSYDYVKAIHNVKYAFALELRPQQNTDEDIYGFSLPENRNYLLFLLINFVFFLNFIFQRCTFVWS